MARPVVLRAPMEASLAQSVEAACASVGVEIISLPEGYDPGKVKNLVSSPALLIAPLPKGVRYVPEPYVRLVTDIFVRLPLLLLCAEKLVRPAIALQDGRINLAGPPFTPEMLAARIRTTLGAPVFTSQVWDSGHFSVHGVVREGWRVREFRGRKWWAATLTPAADEPLESGETAIPAPYIDPNADLDFLVFLPPPNARENFSDLAMQGVNTFRAGAPGKSLHQKLSGFLGSDASGLHLDPMAMVWRLWLTGSSRFRLYSAMRIPPYWLAPPDSNGPRVWTRHARGGDVAIFVTEQFDKALQPGRWIEDQAFNDSAACGGPGILDYLTQASEQRVAGQAVIVEVR